jgi:hypothetical protein
MSRIRRRQSGVPEELEAVLQSAHVVGDLADI